jgi:alcohol dehydrogenase class IV
MLPHSAGLMAGRAPGPLSKLAQSLGDGSGDPEAVAGALAARSGHTRLRTLGVGEEQLPEIAAAVVEHPLLGNTPEPPGADELLETLRAAL